MHIQFAPIYNHVPSLRMKEAVVVVDGAEAHWTTIAAFWATVGVALITVIATAINYYMLRSQADPEVIVFADSDQTRPGIIVLRIANIGRGLAKNVRFKLSESLVQAFGSSPENADVRKIDRGPFVDGISGLGPGAARTVTWGQFWGLWYAYGERTITVTVSYESDRIGIFGPEEYVRSCHLDIKSFASTNASDSRWDKHAADALKRIADVLEKEQRRNFGPM